MVFHIGEGHDGVRRMVEEVGRVHHATPRPLAAPPLPHLELPGGQDVLGHVSGRGFRTGGGGARLLARGRVGLSARESLGVLFLASALCGVELLRRVAVFAHAVEESETPRGVFNGEIQRLRN